MGNRRLKDLVRKPGPAPRFGIASSSLSSPGPSIPGPAGGRHKTMGPELRLILGWLLEKGFPATSEQRVLGPPLGIN